jgi:hypothetical protein
VLVLLADVVSIGSGVVCYHDRLLVVGVLMYFVGCGESYMLVLVDLFKHPIECGAQTVCGVKFPLGKPNAWCATLGVGCVNCHTFFVAGVIFGQAGPFVLCEGNAVVEEQVVNIAQSPDRLLNLLLLGDFLLPAVFSWIRGYDGFVFIHLQCWAAHVVYGGGFGLGEYGKCIMQFEFKFGL